MSDTIICTAVFIAIDGRAAKLYAALKALIKPTKSELGCLSYELY